MLKAHNSSPVVYCTIDLLFGKMSDWPGTSADLTTILRIALLYLLTAETTVPLKTTYLKRQD